MKTYLSTALFLAALLATKSVQASVPLINLVGDDVSAVLYVTDAPTLVKNWQGTPWMKMWNDEQVKKYFAPLRAQMKTDQWDEQCKTETGCTVAELLAMAKGEAIFVMPDIGTLLQAAQTKSDPPLLIAVEVGDNAPKIEKLIADAKARDKEKKYTETTEDFEGVTLHTVVTVVKTDAAPQSQVIWAISDGVLYASPAKDFLQQTLSVAKKGGLDNALGKTDGFMQMRHRVSGAQAFFYANIKGMYPAAQKALVEKQAKNAGNSGSIAFDFATILPALGLDAVNNLYLAATVGENATDLDFGLTYSERRGLVKLFAYTDGAPTQPPFVPGKSCAVSSVRFSIRNFYAALEDTMQSVSPIASGVFEGYVKNYNQRLGIDIKRDLIGSFGDQVIMANAVNDDAAADAPASERFNPFYAISVENATTLTATFEAIKHGLFGESADKFFEKRDYLGHDLYTFSPPQPPAPDGAPAHPARPGFAYAVTDRWFFLGIRSASSVESALQGLDGKQPSFWDKTEVKQNLLADLPDNACGLSYFDLSKVIPVYFDLAVQGMENSRRMAAMQRAAAQARAGNNQSGNPAGSAAAGATDQDASFVDSTAKPDAATLAKYWSYLRSYTSQDAGGIYSTTRIDHPK